MTVEFQVMLYVQAGWAALMAVLWVWLAYNPISERMTRSDRAGVGFMWAWIAGLSIILSTRL